MDCAVRLPVFFLLGVSLARRGQLHFKEHYHFIFEYTLTLTCFLQRHALQTGGMRHSLTTNNFSVLFPVAFDSKAATFTRHLLSDCVVHCQPERCIRV